MWRLRSPTIALRMPRLLENAPTLRRSLFGFTKRKIPEDEEVKYSDLHKNTSIYTLIAFILGTYTFALANTLINSDYFVDSLIKAESDEKEKRDLIKLAKYPFITSYAFVKLWQRGIMQEFVEYLKTYRDGSNRYMYALQILMLMSRNRTLCYHLVIETDFMDTLMAILHDNIVNNSISEVQRRAEAQLISSTLRTISRSTEAQYVILQNLDSISLLETYGNSIVNSQLAQMFSNIINNPVGHSSDTNMKLLNSVFRLTESKNMYTKNVALKCCEILTARENKDNKKEQDAINSLQRYLVLYRMGTFGSNVINYATIGFVYGFARFAFRGALITGGRGSFPLAMVLKSAARTSGVVVAIGSSLSATDYVSYYFDLNSDPKQSFDELKRRAFAVDASIAAYQFMLPALIIYLIHYIPFIILPTILGRSLLTMPKPYSFLTPDQSASSRKYLQEKISVERIRKTE